MKRVAHYYDENSFWFALWERASGPVPIHRRVWAPNVRSGRAALDYVHSAVTDVAEDRRAAAVIDLGCGTGALVSFLHDHTSVPRLVGVTASPTQASAARRWMSVHDGAAPRWEIRVGNYLSHDTIAAPVRPRLFVAIESMVHAPDARVFLGAVANAAEPGDELFVCDDFLADGAHRTDGRSESMRTRTRLVHQFRKGWRVPAITTVADFLSAAVTAGWELVDEADWTPWVRRPGRTTARIFALASTVLSRLARFPFAGNLSGGAALRAGYGMGLFRYRVLRLRRVAA